MTTLECFTAKQQQYLLFFADYGIFHQDRELFLICDLRTINSLKYIDPLHTGRVFALITVTLLKS